MGQEDPRLGPRFIDMSEAYSQELSADGGGSGKAAGHCSWVKACTLRCWGRVMRRQRRYASLRTIGADLVGMSTVPEVIAARQMGIKVLAISCVTNMAAGTTDAQINHEEVLEIGKKHCRTIQSAAARSGAADREGRSERVVCTIRVCLHSFGLFLEEQHPQASSCHSIAHVLLRLQNGCGRINCPASSCDGRSGKTKINSDHTSHATGRDR